MKKKVWRILSLAVVMALAFNALAFANENGEATISASDAVAEPGNVVEIYITAENNPGIAIAGITVNYDSKALKLTKVTDSGIWGEQMHSEDLTPCPYTLFWSNPTVTENYSENGTIATLEFEVSADAKAGKYPVTLTYSYENEDIINVDLEAVKFNTVSGTITVNGDDATQEPDSSASGDEEATEDAMTSSKRGEDIICLKIDTNAAFAYGKVVSIDSDNVNVVPYIKNDRTLVPLRFVSETLGAEVLWEDGWNYCYVKKGDKEIKITFNSADIEVNGEVITYDAPVEVVENRTMVPIRFISEELGYNVHWNQPNQLVVISPAENPWVKDREAELSLLRDVLVTFLLNGLM